MSEYVVFGMASSRNVTFNYTDESSYTKEEWASLSEKDKDEALSEYLWKNVEVWVEND